MKRSQLALALLSASLTTLASSTPTRAQDNLIHLALSSFEAQANAYYAQDLGLFKQAGLNIDIQQYQGGEAIVAAVVGGSIQIGAGNPLPLANAVERGLDVVIIAPGTIADVAQPRSGLFTSLTSSIRSGRDFTGKTVAVNTLHSVDQIAVQAWIDKHGGDSRTVRFVEVPGSLMLDGLTSGRIDAAMFAEPAFTNAMESGRANDVAFAYDALSQRIMVSAWFAARPWALAHQTEIRKFAAALNAGSAWAVKNPAAAAAVLRKYLHTTTQLAHEHHARSLDPAMLQPLFDAAVRYGVLATPIELRRLTL